MKQNQNPTNLQFEALDYTSEDKFQKVCYKFQKTIDGWRIYRDGIAYLNLGEGYRLLKVKFCGVCSTDIDRRFLPFPLPQIIGHEIVAQDIQPIQKTKRYVIEINDSHQARGEQHKDPFCLAGLQTHCPDRLTIGINRLPGGFGHYILAPKNAVIPCDFLSDKVAVLTEPFAAALQAIVSSAPKNGYQVAVLGPRRLGNLIIAALKCFRKSNNLNFKIVAIVKHEHLQKISQQLGADQVINLNKIQLQNLNNRFDIIYDTTSTVSGFLSAIQFTKKQLHLKTTNGQNMNGIPHLTELVVDQLSLLSAQNQQNFKFHWKSQIRQNKTIYICPSLKNKYNAFCKNLQLQIFNGTPQQAIEYLNSSEWNSQLPRFDLAIAGNPQQIGRCIRPIQKQQLSLIRPRGAILIDTSQSQLWNNSKQIMNFFKQDKIIRSSRCGYFKLALNLLKQNPDTASSLQKIMISKIFPSSQLEEGYKAARSPHNIKVIIDHSK